jgi:soluble P-type ATPase
MITIEIPGFGELRLKHLVLDYNGTLGVDGKLLRGVGTRLRRLSRSLRIHVVTADTFGRAREALAALPCKLSILAPSRQAAAKSAYVRRLGAARAVCIGNGRNDRSMLRVAALGIAVVQAEGAAAETLAAADVVVRSPLDALDLLLEPRRLVATLRD